MPLLTEDKITPDDSDAQQSTLKAFSAYDLPIVENLMGIGPIYDADYKVTFTKDTVSIYNP